MTVDAERVDATARDITRQNPDVAYGKARVHAARLHAVHDMMFQHQRLIDKRHERVAGERVAGARDREGTAK